MTIKMLLLAMAAAFPAADALAIDQFPDKIVIDGSGEQDLLPYQFMKTPLMEAFNDPVVWARARALLPRGVCTALYRGYVATWEIKAAQLYLTKVKMGGSCGNGTAVPLTSLFPDEEGPVPAKWFTGELTVPLRSKPKDPRFEIERILDKYQFIQIDKGIVVSYKVALPSNPNYRPCDFVICAGDRVLFEPGSATLAEQMDAQLLRWVMWLRRYPQDKLAIDGHADAVEATPQVVSESRASAVKEFLLSQGIEERRLAVTAYGNTRPVALGDNEAAWAQNRRVVVSPRN